MRNAIHSQPMELVVVEYVLSKLAQRAPDRLQPGCGYDDIELWNKNSSSHGVVLDADVPVSDIFFYNFVDVVSRYCSRHLRRLSPLHSHPDLSRVTHARGASKHDSNCAHNGKKQQPYFYLDVHNGTRIKFSPIAFVGSPSDETAATALAPPVRAVVANSPHSSDVEQPLCRGTRADSSPAAGTNSLSPAGLPGETALAVREGVSRRQTTASADNSGGA